MVIGRGAANRSLNCELNETVTPPAVVPLVMVNDRGWSVLLKKRPSEGEG